jgi:hypothetical protein
MKACVEAPVCEGLRLNIVHDRRRWDVQQLVVWTHIHAQRVRRTQEKIGEREEEINVEEGEDQTEEGREDDDNGPGGETATYNSAALLGAKNHLCMLPR